MKTHTIIPRDSERLLGDDEYIISTTNTQGRITSVNEVLIAYSGYSRAELINAQHNIVRHPDMPRAVFWLAWQTLQDGEHFYGYVKNMAKDGSFYWVFAHILPEHDCDGGITGYHSVRRAPPRAAIPQVVALYQEMCAAEQAAGAKDAVQAGLAVLSRFLGERGLSYEQMVARL